jgi:hypothetical protein
MSKKHNPRSDAAYIVHPGVTAEEADDKGYVIVEWNLSTSPHTPIYGEYRSGGENALPAARAAEAVVGSEKGALVNPNDPVIHGTAEAEAHADGSASIDLRTQMEATRDLVEAGAFDGETVEKAPKAKK